MPEYYVGKAGVDINGAIIITQSAQSMIPFDFTNWKDSRAQEWNFTIEREVMRNTALRLSYIGGRGRNFEQRVGLNSQEAQFNYVARTALTIPGNADLTRPQILTDFFAY